jgi:hypothetical protein
VSDHKGAGIRAEGSNLTVQDSRFIDDEEGILAGSNPRGTIRVIGSEFRGNGNCAAARAHGIYVSAIELPDVEDSHFTDTHEGHHIMSRARTAVSIGAEGVKNPTNSLA